MIRESSVVRPYKYGSSRSQNNACGNGCEELTARMNAVGLSVREVVGLGPRASKPSVLLNFIRANRGKITYGEFSRRLNVGKVKRLGVSYMGYAVKTDDPTRGHISE